MKLEEQIFQAYAAASENRGKSADSPYKVVRVTTYGCSGTHHAIRTDDLFMTGNVAVDTTPIDIQDLGVCDRESCSQKGRGELKNSGFLHTPTPHLRLIAGQ